MITLGISLSCTNEKKTFSWVDKYLPQLLKCANSDMQDPWVDRAEASPDHLAQPANEGSDQLSLLSTRCPSSSTGH